ncbi:MAG TPA: preprotein translocase subunit SecG [Vicinamibacteria bacterium]|nr:preprotein translocase subunit SecG [Vicinamibacteria bacterium]
MVIVYYLVLTLHVVSCLFLIAVVLLQQGKGQDLASAFGGGGTQAAFGPRGSATVLSRATAVLAVLFMVTSLSLSVLRHREASILDKVQAPASAPSPAGASPAAGTPAAAPSPAAPAPGASPSPSAK